MNTLLKTEIPAWQEQINNFDRIEIHPVYQTKDFSEICKEEDANLYSVYGHYRKGGIECLEDFRNRAEADNLKLKLESQYPHLCN